MNADVLPRGPWKLVHVGGTTYGELGYTEHLGFYHFEAPGGPFPGGAVYFSVTRERFWRTHDGYDWSLPTPDDPSAYWERDRRRIARLKLLEAAKRAWGDNPKPLPSVEDDVCDHCADGGCL